MKKLLVSGVMLMLAAASWGQLVEVLSVDKVALPEGVAVEQANVSPDGSYIVFTTLGGSQLSKLDLATGAVKQLSDNGSSTNLSFSADSRNVVFRQNSYDASHRRFSAVKSVDVTNGRETTLVAPTRNLQGVSVKGQTVSTVESGRMQRKAIKGSASEAPVVSINRGQLCVTVDGTTRTISPLGTSGNSYLWPSISPDGTRVLFYAAGYGCYTCNLDGSDLKRVGNLRAAVWASDNLVVGMYDLNDGRMTTSSELIAARPDGSASQKITDDSVIAVLPSVADGKIVFSTPVGEVYTMNVKLK